jgi:hypothetical protein
MACMPSSGAMLRSQRDDRCWTPGHGSHSILLCPRLEHTCRYSFAQSPSAKGIAQYLQLWDLVAGTTMTVGRQDEAVWRCTKNGKFSVSSAYKLFFITNTQFACAKPIWRSKAPMRCKFFMWLAVHKRCLTADNLERRGWPTTRNALSASLLAKIVLTSSCTVALLDRFGAGSRLGLVLPSLYLVLRSRIPNTGG